MTQLLDMTRFLSITGTTWALENNQLGINLLYIKIKLINTLLSVNKD